MADCRASCAVRHVAWEGAALISPRDRNEVGTSRSERQLRAAPGSLVPGSASPLPRSHPRRQPQAARPPSLPRPDRHPAPTALERGAPAQASPRAAAGVGRPLRRVPQLSRAGRAAGPAPPPRVRAVPRGVRRGLGRRLSARGLTLARTSRSVPSMQLAFTLPGLLLDLLLVLLLVLIGRPGDRGVLASIDLRS